MLDSNRLKWEIRREILGVQLPSIRYQIRLSIEADRPHGHWGWAPFTPFSSPASADARSSATPPKAAVLGRVHRVDHRGEKQHREALPKLKTKPKSKKEVNGERAGNRTPNLVIKSHLLCQLSYAPGRTLELSALLPFVSWGRSRKSR